MPYFDKISGVVELFRAEERCRAVQHNQKGLAG
jgi:hypothetical protein